jgi:hypothetical protein
MYTIEENNIINCIKKAKEKKINQTTIIKMVGEIYNPYTSKAINIATPWVANKMIKAAQPYTQSSKAAQPYTQSSKATQYYSIPAKAIKGGKTRIHTKNKKLRKNKTRRIR